MCQWVQPIIYTMYMKFERYLTLVLTILGMGTAYIFIRNNQPMGVLQQFYIYVSTITFVLLVVRFYVYIAVDINASVREKGSFEGRSTPMMWLVMFGRSLIYMVIPATILGLILVLLAMWLS